jgi:C1A family cysteine protease
MGYSSDKGYLIKNSWGSIWGIKGYAYVDNTVGVCNYAMYPILESSDLSLNEFKITESCK